LDIEVRTQSDVKLINLRGRLNLGEPLDRLGATLTDLLNAGHSRFILDLREVSTIDSSGIGLLVRYLTTAKQRGGSLKLLNPSKFAVQTLKLVRVLSLFEVFEDPQLAVASFA
jgi:anti-sigma B factor antagonist